VLAVLAVPSGGGLSSGEKEDRGNGWVLGAFSLIALLMAFFSSYTDRIGDDCPSSKPATRRQSFYCACEISDDNAACESGVGIMSICFC